MKITFYGAARAVTGSCYCVEANGKRVLIDCGLQQGADETDNSALPFDPMTIDQVIVTHAHIDHSGRLPLLAKLGYRNPIETTRLTAQLLGIMLRDSAYIQESEVSWQNQKGKRAGREPVEPLYTVQDAEAALALIKTHEYGETCALFDGVSFRFVDSGHILGSASIELWLTEAGVTKKIVFSGDIGNVGQPVIRDPQLIAQTDYAVMESTYGDRNHEPVKDYAQTLAQIFESTFSGGGNVVIPSFAVGRTQELLYYIREIKEQRLVKSHPEFEVYVDSPLAEAATKIFSGDLTGYLDEEAIRLIGDGEKIFSFPGLKLVESGEDSKAINDNTDPKVIISASGMCDAGRIRHHLKHNLWRPECAVVFVGFQAPGTLGRRLLDGMEEARLFGEEIAVKARIYNLKGLSAHADRDHLLAWAENFKPRPARIFVTHGESGVSDQFAATLTERGAAARVPDPGEVYDLAEDKVFAAGIVREAEKQEPREAQKTETPAVAQDAFSRLLDMGGKLEDAIRSSKGRSQSDLRRRTDMLRSLLSKWKR
jgi:metallo-beta-lactamase family protein